MSIFDSIFQLDQTAIPYNSATKPVFMRASGTL